MKGQRVRIQTQVRWNAEYWSVYSVCWFVKWMGKIPQKADVFPNTGNVAWSIDDWVFFRCGKATKSAYGENFYEILKQTLK